MGAAAVLPTAIDHPDPPKDDAISPRRERPARRSSAPQQPPRPRTHSDARPDELPPNSRPHTGTQPAAVEPGSRRKHEYEPGSVLVRKAVKGTGYQARGWVYSPPVGSINLGLYRGAEWQDDVVSERLAAAVAGEFKERSRRVGVCPLEVFFAMQAEGKIRRSVVPPGAKKAGGVWVAERFCYGSGTVTVPGTFPTAADAARALFARLRELS